MNITVNSLTSVTYSDEGNMELSTKDFESLDSIARSLSAKYHGWYGLVFDDIYEVVWEKISSVVKSGCRDFAFIYRCCSNGAIDLVRKAKMQSVRGFNADAEIMDSALYGGESYDYDFIDDDEEVKTNWNPDFNDTYETGTVSQDCSNFYELLGLFEKGSREWEWLFLCGIRNKIIEVDPVIYDRMFTDGHTVDYEISKLMGYKHQSNNGYRAIKERVQYTVAKYLALPTR